MKEMPPAERAALFLLLGVAIVLRLLYAFHFRIDSDEPQHLHVVWGWTQGLLPYRDYFDNHMPLFQAAAAPLFKAFGPRADIVACMRLAMLPLFLGMVWMVQRIAAQLTSPHVGWWLAALTALFPPFFLLSVEFRPDNLWALLWLALLSLLIGGRYTLPRCALMGLLLGLAFCVSLKTTLLVIAMLLGAFALWGAPVPWRSLPARLGVGLAAALLPLALVCGYFAYCGAWAEFIQGVIRHNTSVQSKISHHLLRQTLLWIPFFLVTLAAALGLRRLHPDRRAAFASAYLFFTAACYLTVLRCFWPMFALEDYIPFFPALLAGLLPPLALRAARYFAPNLNPNLSAAALPAGVGLRLRLGLGRRGRPLAAFLPLLLAAELAYLLLAVPPWRDETRDKVGLIADVLRLSDPTDYILDSKGETIYRRRAIFAAMESVTRRGMMEGRINGDFSADLIRTATPLISPHRMPNAAKPFLNSNYLPVAYRLQVLGQILFKPGREPLSPATLPFQIAVPARYSIVTESGPVPGRLNGRPFTGGEYLPAGAYTLAPAAPTRERIVLVWTQALERGFSPFAKIKPDFITQQD